MRLRERLQKAEEQAAALPAPAKENPEMAAFLESLTDDELLAFYELAQRGKNGDSEEQARLAGAWRQGPETLRAYLAVEVSAARALLEQIRAAIEIEDLAERVAALEDRTATKGAPQ